MQKGLMQFCASDAEDSAILIPTRLAKAQLQYQSRLRYEEQSPSINVSSSKVDKQVGRFLILLIRKRKVPSLRMEPKIPRSVICLLVTGIVLLPRRMPIPSNMLHIFQARHRRQAQTFQVQV